MQTKEGHGRKRRKHINISEKNSNWERKSASLVVPTVRYFPCTLTSSESLFTLVFFLSAHQLATRAVSTLTRWFATGQRRRVQEYWNEMEAGKWRTERKGGSRNGEKYGGGVCFRTPFSKLRDSWRVNCVRSFYRSCCHTSTVWELDNMSS